MTNPKTCYHGTKAELGTGDLIEAGHRSNFGTRKQAAFVYLTQTLDAAIWGAELAVGDGPGRVYVVEATGALEDDPNVTDKRFPGNVTLSYRSRAPLRVVAEVRGWTGHTADQLERMRAFLDDLERRGIEAIED